MTDPYVIAGGIASAPVVLDAYKRLLGPWLDDRGQAIKSALTRERDTRRVADWAARKASTDQPGAIPPRVAASVLDQAQWAENKMVAEYLSGVLASARTSDGVSDRGQSASALIQRLTSDQLMVHFLVYAALRERVRGRGEEFAEWTTKTCIVDVLELLEAAGWALEPSVSTRMTAAIYGLERERLLNKMTHGYGDYLSSTVSYTRGRVFDATRAYLVFTPSPHGIGLFLEAHGLGERWFNDLASTDLEFTLAQDDVPAPPTMHFVEEFPAV